MKWNDCGEVTTFVESSLFFGSVQARGISKKILSLGKLRKNTFVRARGLFAKKLEDGTRNYQNQKRNRRNPDMQGETKSVERNDVEIAKSTFAFFQNERNSLRDLWCHTSLSY